jgi:hypothetical protein
VSALVPPDVIDFGFKPRAHQKAAHALRLTCRFLVLVWHRRAGKTLWCILELILAALASTRPDSRFGYIAPQLKQVKGIAWDYLRRYARLVPGVVVHEGELSVEFPNGARIRLFGADNPDSFRGLYFDGLVLDEKADMKPNLWGEILRPALADREGWAIFIGTPKGVNIFSELYYRALKGEPGWAADLRRWSDTDALTEAEVEQMRREMTPSQFAQEMDCDFAAAVDDALIKLDLVLAAQERTFGRKEYHYAPKVLGVDVARYGDDRTVIIGRQGLVCFKPTIIKQADTMLVASLVAQKVASWKPDATFVDVGSFGAGVVDRLKQLKVPGVLPVDFGGKATNPRFENKRAEMWWEMAQWLPSAALPDGHELAQDLTAPRYTYANVRGRLQLESKEDMRARGMPSPDVGDALACTFAAPVTPHADREARGGTTQTRDYDPYGGTAEYDPYA